MRKTGLFFGKKLLLLTLFAWLVLLDKAVLLRMEAIEQAGKESTEPKKGSETEAPDPIRVLLMDTGYCSDYHSSVRVFCDGAEHIYTKDSPELEEGVCCIEPKEGFFRLLSVERAEGNPVYEGILEIHKTEDGLVLINELPLETYLEAVVPSEMPASYEEEALKAQAVCARTYAEKQMEGEGIGLFDADVDDSVNDQVYANIFPKEQTSRAVRDTEGQVLCQDGELIQAFYFSTSAGVTSTDEIWGAKESASYLKSVECGFDAGEPWSHWYVDIPWRNLDRYAEAETGIPCTVEGLEITRKSQSGAVTGLMVRTSENVFELENEYEIREFLSPKDCVITEKDGTQTDGGMLLPSSYFTVKTENETDIRIEGGGYGHGVGMSQNAANHMAEEGWTYEEILHYFFRNVEITEAKTENS